VGTVGQPSVRGATHLILVGCAVLTHPTGLSSELSLGLWRKINWRSRPERVSMCAGLDSTMDVSRPRRP
jgi:hypothetical protein